VRLIKRISTCCWCIPEIWVLLVARLVNRG
jgi:hypothetical protein